jgi:hypothetical protein
MKPWRQTDVYYPTESELNADINKQPDAVPVTLFEQADCGVTSEAGPRGRDHC